MKDSAGERCFSAWFVHQAQGEARLPEVGLYLSIRARGSPANRNCGYEGQYFCAKQQ